MKKTLIALAVLATSSAAMAQSSVTLYGIADAGIFKDKGQSTELRSGGLNGSRLGFRGTEDLGGGLSAIFTLEQGINLVNGENAVADTPFNRQAYVGLAGGFGTLKLGNVYTAYDDVAAGAALGFDGTFDSQDIFGSMQYQANPGSNIYYATPEFGGFSGAVSYSLNVDKQDYTSVHVKYAGGPIYVGLGYQDQSDVNDGKLTTLNGSYDFGVAKLLLAYGTTSGLANNTDDLSIGAEVPVGPALVVSVGYAMSEPDTGPTRRGFALMGNYSLSKRTIVYVGYRNDNTAAADAGVGVDSRFGVGIRHAF